MKPWRSAGELRPRRHKALVGGKRESERGKGKFTLFLTGGQGKGRDLMGRNTCLREGGAGAKQEEERVIDVRSRVSIVWITRGRADRERIDKGERGEVRNTFFTRRKKSQGGEKKSMRKS